MKLWRALVFSLIVLLAAATARAFDADADVRDVLATQVDAWNRGNVEAFVATYAENCTFMGKQVVHSREQVRALYRKSYPTAAAMGKLAFNNLDVRELGEHVAVVTGNWHLERNPQAGGNTGGYFSLVLKDVDDEWKIVLDHTTALK